MARQFWLKLHLQASPLRNGSNGASTVGKSGESGKLLPGKFDHLEGNYEFQHTEIHNLQMSQTATQHFVTEAHHCHQVTFSFTISRLAWQQAIIRIKSSSWYSGKVAFLIDLM